MKKKIGLIALVGCLGLTLTGCEGSTEDLNKQMTKMNKVIEDGDLFDDDYQVKGEMIVVSDGERNSVKYHLEKDDDNIWVKMETVEDGEEKYFETWAGEKDDKYYAFYDDNGKKTYASVDEDEMEDAIEDVVSGIEGLGTSLDSLYKTLAESLKGTLKSCESKLTGTTCNVEKSIFGTVKFTITQEVAGATTEMSYSLRGGKIREVSTKMTYGEDSMEIIMKYSYWNQIVRLPKIDEFEKIGD